jgi:hypothetical protein
MSPRTLIASECLMHCKPSLNLHWSATQVSKLTKAEKERLADGTDDMPHAAAGRPRSKLYRLMHPHPLAGLYCLKHRAKIKIPILAGDPPPRPPPALDTAGSALHLMPPIPPGSLRSARKITTLCSHHLTIRPEHALHPRWQLAARRAHGRASKPNTSRTTWLSWCRG